MAESDPILHNQTVHVIESEPFLLYFQTGYQAELTGISTPLMTQPSQTSFGCYREGKPCTIPFIFSRLKLLKFGCPNR